MFARIQDHRPRFRLLPQYESYVALLAAVAGCDRKPQWRNGVGTDAEDVRPGSEPRSLSREQRPWRCQLSPAAGDALIALLLLAPRSR